MTSNIEPLTEEEIGELERDALRWRALMASDRIRVMGWAGMPGRKAHDGYMHMGVEFWSDHPAKDDPQHAQGACRAQLAAYAEALVKRLPTTPRLLSSLKQERERSAAQVPPPIAATVEAYEKAAKACDKIAQGHKPHSFERSVALACSKAVRSLSPKDKNEAVCDVCGAPIDPRADTCSNCG